jgi:hypothetical protein
MQARWSLLAAVALISGCASYDGYTLAPGRSTAAEVEATMGVPSEKLSRDGELLWYYSRGPMGFHVYVARIGPDGVLRALEQRLTLDNVRRVVPGQSTRAEVRELFGPPFVVSELPRLQREVWEYQLLDVSFRWKLWIQFSADGIVREVLQMRHPDEDPPGGDKN